ncbi:MAG: LPS export ABC transporter periplasmic protein LptC [bacterium]
MTSSKHESGSEWDPKACSRLKRAPAGAFSLLVVSLLFLSLCIAVTDCSNQGGENVPVDADASEIAEGFTLTQTVEGRKAWVLKAGSARSLRDKNLISVYSPHLDFYTAEGKIYSTLESDSGIYYLETADVKAIGHVTVVSSDSAVLETDSLKWLSREKKIRTEGSVRVVKGATVITGKGLVSDPGLENIKIERNFRAETRDLEAEESER